MTGSRIITIHKLEGSTVTYQRPTYREIELNYLRTEETQFDRIERGAVTGGIPLVWAKLVGVNERP